MAALILAATQGGCGRADRGKTAAESTSVRAAAHPILVLPVPAAPTPSMPTAEQIAFMNASARGAWKYVAREMTTAGFVGATKNYQFLTVWDMASTLAAVYSAHELRLINDSTYRQMIGRTLTSLETIPLVDHAAFNRMYSARTGGMVDGTGVASADGIGWSALDHGRLLVWLSIVGSHDKEFSARGHRIFARLDMSRLVKGGYLQGETIDAATGARRTYQEGRIGYEQYAAEGFERFAPDPHADSARDFAVNGRAVQVNGQTLVADTRGDDVLTSEPFVLMGLEQGWVTPNWRSLALSVLAAQEARFKQTGIVTMVSEDAIPVPPSYFYYYLLYRNGHPFVVATVGGTVNDSFPRWVSAKAAFGYHALAPSDYTWRALQAVKWGGSPSGWTAGVYEGTKQSTKTFNLNTAAIVLESAAYMIGNCPLDRGFCGTK